MRKGFVLAGALLWPLLSGSRPARAACTTCQNPSFAPATRVLGEDLVYSSALVVADFDGDGIPDIAVRDELEVVVYLGRGGGNFGLGILTPVPELNVSSAFAVGDFNEDGRPDLVVSISGTSGHGVAILLGGGNGRFLVGPIIDDPDLNGLDVGDVDKDGHLDVVTISYDGTVLLLRGDGHGGLTPAGAFPTGGFFCACHSVVTGDLNGDGHADVAITDSYGNLAIMLGSASGFGPVVPVGVGDSHNGHVIIGDVTGDGKADLVVSSFYPANTLIYPGDGNGGFGPALSVNMGGWPVGYAIADLNGDGKPDLVAVGYQFNELVTRLGDGAGGFGPATNLGIVQPSSVSVADLDGDGIPDFVTGNGNDLTIVMGDGTGAPASKVVSLAQAPEAIVAADFDKDGKLDLAVVRGGGFPSTLSILRGQGAGAFGPEETYSIGDTSYGLAVADLNGDGYPDLVLLSGSFSVLETVMNDGTGHFIAGTKRSSVCSSFSNPVVADLNEDGRADVLVACGDSIQVFIGDGAGGFEPPTSITVQAAFLAAGDVNGDGHVDLVASNVSGQLNVFLGDGYGNFAAPIASDLPHFQANGVLLADLDGDGHVDIVTSAHFNGAFIDAAYGDGAGRFGNSKSFAIPADKKPVIAADFNGDGHPDVLLLGFSTAAVMMNDGAGNLLAPRAYEVGGTVSLAAGDFDGDGRPDIAAASKDHSSTTILLNTNCKARRLSYVPAATTCSAPGVPVVPPPVVRLTDDGENFLPCSAGDVTMSLAAGAPGAVLSGATTVPVTSGLATFSNVSIDLAGAYRVAFAHSGAASPTAGGLRIGAGASPSLAGPQIICGQNPAVYDAGAGFSSYVWTLDGAPVSFQRMFTAPFLGPGAHTLAVSATQGLCTGSASTSISNAPPTATSIAPTSGSRGGFTPITMDGGCFAAAATLTLGGLPAHLAGPPSSTKLIGTTHQHDPGTVDVVVTNPDGQFATLPGAFTYLGGTTANLLTPCRVFDTRAGGGAAISQHAIRFLPAVGTCGIPNGAVALIANVTVTQPDAVGNISVGAGTVGVVSFSPGETRATSTMVNLTLNESGTVRIVNNSNGGVHVILDVTGYFY